MTARQQPSQTLARTARLTSKPIAWRRAIHRNPELGFREIETARLVADALSAMGIVPRVGVSKTGIVADIAADRPGRWIALRADMDALPIHEANDCDYRSSTPGVMHACGHDAHTAMLPGTAALFAQHPSAAGGVRLIFQPCEEDADVEGLSSTQHMVLGGMMDGMSAVLALHVTPLLPVGKVGYDEAISADMDDFVLTQPAMLTIGSVHGGCVRNLIPSEIRLAGTLRARSGAARLSAMRACDRAGALARALGAQAEWRWAQPAHRFSLNDRAALDALIHAARNLHRGAWRRAYTDVRHRRVGAATGAAFCMRRGTRC